MPASLRPSQVSDVGPSATKRGLRGTRWSGRVEVMSTDPLVVLDGAHNPAACEAIAESVEQHDFDETHLIFGAMTEKDHQRMAEGLPEADSVHLCRPDIGRAASLDTLSDAFTSRRAEVARDGAVPTAVERALDVIDGGDCVLITGSLYVVAEARDRWVRS